jgi:hypothetical protein
MISEEGKLPDREPFMTKDIWPRLVDIDGDGIFDLPLGRNDGWMHFYDGHRFSG